MTELPKTRAEALALGLKRYQTGRPCPRGHVAPRLVSIRQCIECGRENYIAWRKNDPQKVRDAARKWRKSNPEKAKEQKARYHAKHRKSISEERKARYLATDPSERKTKSAAYYAANAEKIKARTRSYYHANRDSERAKKAAYYIENPEKARDAKAKRRVKLGGSTGYIPRGWQAQLRRKQKGKCAYCKINLHKAGEHMDHIIPISAGGKHEKSNVQLTCPTCNKRKNAKDPIVFAQELGMLL